MIRLVIQQCMQNVQPERLVRKTLDPSPSGTNDHKCMFKVCCMLYLFVRKESFDLDAVPPSASFCAHVQENPGSARPKNFDPASSGTGTAGKKESQTASSSGSLGGSSL
jgi:hypothetical protein